MLLAFHVVSNMSSNPRSVIFYILNIYKISLRQKLIDPLLILFSGLISTFSPASLIDNWQIKIFIYLVHFILL